MEQKYQGDLLNLVNASIAEVLEQMMQHGMIHDYSVQVSYEDERVEVAVLPHIAGEWFYIPTALNREVPVVRPEAASE